MPEDKYEPNRILGMPVGRGPEARHREEPQRVLGIPVDWFGSVGSDLLRPLRHPVRAFRRWKRRRRLGPYALDDDDLQ
jgi:hypothetical protein